jgi:hypothetical protein
VRELNLVEGAPVIVYLRDPKEKVWGLLLSILPSGLVVRGLDLRTFDDWLRQEARGDEPGIGLVTLFYPMGRVERMERDESIGPIEGYADRFRREVGRSVYEVLLGAEEPPETGPFSTAPTKDS